MFETLLTRALNRRDDCSTFDEYVAHSAGRRRTGGGGTVSGFLKRLRQLRIGRLDGYDGVDTVDGDHRPDRRWLDMLPRVVDARIGDAQRPCGAADSATSGSSAASASWQPVALDAHRCDVDTVLDRFVRSCVHDARNAKSATVDERRMERFYVIRAGNG